MIIIGVANQKGGVGKTTTAHNLGAGLALKGYRILMIDLDPQANLTDSCQLRLKAEEPSTMQVMDGECPLKDALRPVGDKLDLLPSHLILAGADSYFAQAIRREERLYDALEPVLAENFYQAIILDCPPNLGLIAQNAFRVMTHLLIPVQCHYHALEGLRLMYECLERWRKAKLLRNDFRILGLLPTFFDQRKNICKDVLDHLRDNQGEMMLDTVIRDNVQLAEAPSNGLDVYQHSPKSFGAQDYQTLVEEVERKLGFSKGRRK